MLLEGWLYCSLSCFLCIAEDNVQNAEIKVEAAADQTRQVRNTVLSLCTSSNIHWRIWELTLLHHEVIAGVRNTASVQARVRNTRMCNCYGSTWGEIQSSHHLKWDHDVISGFEVCNMLSSFSVGLEGRKGGGLKANKHALFGGKFRYFGNLYKEFIILFNILAVIREFAAQSETCKLSKLQQSLLESCPVHSMSVFIVCWYLWLIGSCIERAPLSSDVIPRPRWVGSEVLMCQWKKEPSIHALDRSFPIHPYGPVHVLSFKPLITAGMHLNGLILAGCLWW